MILITQALTVHLLSTLTGNYESLGTGVDLSRNQYQTLQPSQPPTGSSTIYDLADSTENSLHGNANQSAMPPLQQEEDNFYHTVSNDTEVGDEMTSKPPYGMWQC